MCSSIHNAAYQSHFPWSSSSMGLSFCLGGRNKKHSLENNACLLSPNLVQGFAIKAYTGCFKQLQIYIFYPQLQMRKLRFQEVKSLGLEHTGSKNGRSGGLRLDVPASKVALLMYNLSLCVQILVTCRELVESENL